MADEDLVDFEDDAVFEVEPVSTVIPLMPAIIFKKTVRCEFNAIEEREVPANGE